MKSSELVALVMKQKPVVVCEYLGSETKHTTPTDKSKAEIPYLDYSVLCGNETVHLQDWGKRGWKAGDFPKVNFKRGQLVVAQVSTYEVTKYGTRSRIVSIEQLD